jgi:hypothetical protein
VFRLQDKRSSTVFLVLHDKDKVFKSSDNGCHGMNRYDIHGETHWW